MVRALSGYLRKVEDIRMCKQRLQIEEGLTIQWSKGQTMVSSSYFSSGIHVNHFIITDDT